MSAAIEWGNSALEVRVSGLAPGERVVVDYVGPRSAAPTGPAVNRLGPVEILLSGDALPQGSRHVGLGTTLALRYLSHGVEEAGDTRTLRITQQTPSGVLVVSRWTLWGELPVLRATAEVHNEGDEPVTVEYLSSFVYAGFADFAEPDWATHLQVHIPHNTLLGEFQWRSHHLPELGVWDVGFGPDDVHSSKKRISVGSIGTQPSTEYLPAGALTHHGLEQAWLWQVEHNGSWHWEVGDHRTQVYLAAGGPNDQEHQWFRTLQPGEGFTSAPAAIAAVAGGGLDEAVTAMTRYRRRIRRPNADNVELPVVFNDFMNCLRADPTEEKLLPVIAAAARAGCEYFCVDAGWYSDEPGWWSTVGAWEVAEARFPHGFGAVFDRVRAAGMIPGLWIEPEVVGVDSPVVAQLPDDAFFWRHGRRVNTQGRHQLDFRSPDVVARMDRIVDRLIADYGLGYLKFDYNVNGGPGTERHAESVGDGLLGHNRAFLAWIDGLFARHPGLVIEACSSGGARIDYATLARHSILSTSDQTSHLRYVPIAAGAPTGVTPEQAAVWVYPQPEFSDEENALCVVNGLLARPQLSGGLAELSPAQLELVAAGVDVYKQYRRELADAVPVWPTGLPTWDEPWTSLALRTSARTLLSVWRRGGDDTRSLRLPHLRGREVTVEFAYPLGFAGSYEWDGVDGVLHVTLPTAPSARLLMLTAR